MIEELEDTRHAIIEGNLATYILIHKWDGLYYAFERKVVVSVDEYRK